MVAFIIAFIVNDRPLIIMHKWLVIFILLNNGLRLAHIFTARSAIRNVSMFGTSRRISSVTRRPTEDQILDI